MPKIQIADIEFEKKAHETKLAWLLIIDGKRIWIPKSVAEVDFGDKIVSVPIQWAIDNNLV